MDRTDRQPVGWEDLIHTPSEQVYAALLSDNKGLTEGEARQRQQRYGRNDIVRDKPFSWPKRIEHVLLDPFSALLVFAGALAFLIGVPELAVVMFIIVVVNAALSVVQEWRGEKAMEVLSRWVPESARVVRDGTLRKIDATELVPGDVIRLELGDRVPADARLVEANEMWTNNVPLTGESAPQSRRASPADKRVAPMESPNLVFMSTSVTGGSGVAVIFATGMATKFGQIARLTQDVAPSPSPLQKEIDRAARYDLMIAIGVGLAFFAVGTLFLHLEVLSAALLMIGVMVACVPEGLQLTISTALAVSLVEMARNNVLVKKLAAVQTLGSVTVICTDKTGTITKGEMTASTMWVDRTAIDVSDLWFGDEGQAMIGGVNISPGAIPDMEWTLQLGALCNNGKLVPPTGPGKAWEVLGDPTDAALLVAAKEHGVDPEEVQRAYPRTAVLPFDPTRMMMATLHDHDNGTVICVKGALVPVLRRCGSYLSEGRAVPLNENKKAIEDEEASLTKQGLRVLALAYKIVPERTSDLAAAESGLTFAGLIGMKDPPRPEVREALQQAKRAGVRTIIVTGDHARTASAVAREVGLFDGEGMIITGEELEALDDGKLSDALDAPQLIFARVSPAQKQRIVSAVKAKNEVVAVTGDGANDAPSLKEADIGVAMGVSGTDVAREAADIVLLDDSYASIIRSVKLGRGVYDNVRKFVVYVFTHNWAELIPYLLYGLLAIPLPLLAVQILAIDLIIDVPPSLALSREPPEEGVMDRPPRSKRQRLFDRDFLVRSVVIGSIIAVVALAGCVLVWSEGGWEFGMQLPNDSMVYREGTTMAFAGIVVAQMANLLGSRTLDTSILRMNWTSNRWIWVGLAWMVVSLLLMVYYPPLQEVFGTAGLDLAQWAILGGGAVAVLAVDELMKYLLRRQSVRRSAQDGVRN